MWATKFSGPMEENLARMWAMSASSTPVVVNWDGSNCSRSSLLSAKKLCQGESNQSAFFVLELKGNWNNGKGAGVRPTIIQSHTTSHIVFYKHTLFWAEPGKEIKITTNKLTKMCLKFGQFSAWHAYKPRAYKKTMCYKSRFKQTGLIGGA